MSNENKQMYRLAPDGSLTQLFFRTLRKLHLHMQPGYSQQRVLGLLDEMGPTSQKKIQGILDIKCGSLSELCTKLLDKGYIEKSRDENDRRNAVLKITEKGRVKRQEIVRQKDDRLFEVLSDEERTQLRKILEKLYENGSEDIDFLGYDEQKGDSR